MLASIQGDWPETKRCAEESRALASELGDPGLARESLLTLGRARIAEGDPDGALQLFDEAEQAALAAGDPQLVGMARFNAGYLELTRGDYPQAEASAPGRACRARRCDHHHGAARSLAALGSVALHEQPHRRRRRAAAREHRAREPRRRSRDHGLGARAARRHARRTEPQRAARLLGAAEALREALESTLEGIELTLHEQALARSIRRRATRRGRRAARCRPTTRPRSRSA